MTQQKDTGGSAFPAPLTDEQITLLWISHRTGKFVDQWSFAEVARTVEAVVNKQWADMLAAQEPLGYFWKDAAGTIYSEHPINNFRPCFALPPAPPASEPVGTVESSLQGAGGFHVKLSHGANMPCIGTKLYIERGR